MLHTVAEVSKTLEVSKVTIYNKLNSLKDELKPYIKHRKGILHIDDKGLLIIKEDLGLMNVEDVLNSEDNIKDSNIDNDNDLKQFKDICYLIKTLEETIKTGQENYINSLLGQIELLKSELDKKDDQINNTLRLLENSQVLIKDNKEKILVLENQEHKEKRSLFDLFKKK